MARHTYSYSVHGTAPGDQTWNCVGTVIGEFKDVPEAVMKDTFIRLTNGKVIFGKPGVGCRGPYEITQLIILKVKT